MAGQYAKNTEVPVDRSLADIRKTLKRYGATRFVFGEEEGLALVGFAMNDRQVRFLLRLPDPADEEFTKTPTGRDRAAAAAEEAYETAVKRIYRVFNVAVLAKLELVASGLVTFDEEFLAQLVLPGGATVGESVRGKVAAAYETGQVPALLPDYGRPAITAGGD